MKLTKISVWSTAFVVALVYTILNAITLTVVSLITLLSGTSSSSVLGSSATVPTSPVQWLVYLGMSFAVAFIITVLSVLIFNLLAKIFVIHIKLEEAKPKSKRK